MSEWYRQWFGEEYLDLYPHRDESEAETLIDALERRGLEFRGRAVLDLACGAGRHAEALTRRGSRVTALDLSEPLLRAARRRGAGLLVRADMRALPLRGETHDVVLNLFTSFGYFATDLEHRRVLVEVSRVLKPGAWLVLDFLNSELVRSRLVPRDERTINGRLVVQERRISEDGRFVIKEIRFAGEPRAFTEQVRLYSRADLEALMLAAGVPARECMGGYDGSPFSTGSARLIVLGRRSEP